MEENKEQFTAFSAELTAADLRPPEAWWDSVNSLRIPFVDWFEAGKKKESGKKRRRSNVAFCF